MNEQLRAQVNSLAQTINKKRRLMFEKLKNEKFEDAAKLRDDIQLKQKEMLDILTY
tara:strand:- start:10188 stop:10355 length:168 start_codon:yes stop_codon:yes gene_type:complete